MILLNVFPIPFPDSTKPSLRFSDNLRYAYDKGVSLKSPQIIIGYGDYLICLSIIRTSFVRFLYEVLSLFSIPNTLRFNLSFSSEGFSIN